MFIIQNIHSVARSSYVCTRFLLYKGIHTKPKRQNHENEIAINQVTLNGRVHGTPQMKFVDAPALKFSIATDISYEQGYGNIVKKTDVHNVCLLNPELAETLFKSLQPDVTVLVIGKLSDEKATIGEGQSLVSTIIEAEEVIISEA